MAQPDTRKYQLFPRDCQSTASPVRVLAPEEAYAKAMGQNTEKADKVTAGGLRFRLKDHSAPIPARRRKISVPELGPMTTVHESSMDSRRSCHTGRLSKFADKTDSEPSHHTRTTSTS